MADKDSKNLPVLGLMATAAAIGGAIVFTQVPLEVPRPTASQGLSYRDRSVQDVDARLWEDPFAAVGRQLRAAAQESKQDTAALVELAKQIQKQAQPDSNVGAHSESAGELDPCDAPAVRREECTPHSLPWLIRDMRFALGQERVAAEAGEKPKKPPRVLVLGVMVSNSPYVDGEERRRRMRFAVQSALNLGQYSPVNAEHIGFVVNYEEAGLPQVIPFEWFRRKGSDPERRALVLWLEEESLIGYPARSPAPLANLAKLASVLRSRTKAAPEQLEFKFIGPATSGALKILTSELKRETDAKSTTPKYGALAGGELLLALATAAEEQMVCSRKERTQARKEGVNVSERCSLATFFERNGDKLFGSGTAPLKFLRAVANDDTVSYTLIDELKRRGVDLTSGRDDVALVSEWDTYYGRMLPQAFLRSLDTFTSGGEPVYQSVCEQDPEEKQVKDVAQVSHCPVLRFSYLRGLDGTQAGAAVTTAAAAAAKDAAKSAVSSEQSEGAKQFDYLRRLSGRMRETNQDLRRRGREISAIGVIGSDVYDKLAVLRALRKQFPRAVFFTTDLDARLLDAADFTYTRNLIVGSSYGLQLHPCVQKEIPPFRNVYQTSMFFATRVALFNAFADIQTRIDRCPEYDESHLAAANETRQAQPLDNATLSSLLYPRVFEVGKSRAWDLTVEPITTPGAPCLGLHLCANVHPARAYLVKQSSRVAWITLGLFVAGAAGAYLWRRKRLREEPEDSVFKRPERLSTAWVRWGLIAWALLLTAICLIIAQADWRDAAGEPFAWTDGISVWPTQILRLVAILLAAFFIGDVITKIRRNDDELSREFGLRAGGRDPRSWLSRLLGRFEVGADSANVDAARLWRQYLESGRPLYTFIRAGVMTLLFGLITAGLFQLFGWPSRPIRGNVSSMLDWVLGLHLSLFAAYLLFAVNDATRLTTMFIYSLTKHQAKLQWPADTVNRISTRLGEEISDHLATWYLFLQLIAKRTAVISTLIYYPFIVGALAVLCRSAVFDNWNMPIGMLIIFAIGLVIAAAGPLMMQLAANKAKTERVKALRAKLLQSKGSGQESRITALEALTEHVQNIKEGAFQPFLEQPLVRAALLPFGGAGGLYLLDLFNFVRF